MWAAAVPFASGDTVDGAFAAADSVFAADIDGDGDLDVLAAASLADDIAWWGNDGMSPVGWSTAKVIDGALDGANSVHAADLDGDGDLDVLGGGFFDELSWWENDGLSPPGFGSRKVIDATFDAVRSVYAADLDGDGDLDVLGADSSDNDIAWWENNGASPPSFGSRNVIDGSFGFPLSVSAADLDGDGDLDVLAAASSDDDIAWWENDGLSPPGFSARKVIDGSFDGASSVLAADLDGDGDLDVLGAAPTANNIAWWENRGGQFALPTTPLAPAQVTSPGEQFVFQVEAVHNGRSGDTDMELATLELLFDDGGTPLTDAQANSIIDNVRVYHEAIGPDPVVASVDTLTLNNGVQQLSFVDGDPNAQVAFGANELYSVSLDFVAGGLLDKVRVTHRTLTSSSAEVRDHDIPLKMQFLPNVSTATMVLQEGVCPAELVRANQTLTGTQTLAATTSVTLGENLTIQGDNIEVKAPSVSILGNTSISGPFSIGTTPSCP